MSFTRGDTVVLAVEQGATLSGWVALASPTGASLVVLFDGLLDGCVGAMPLAFDGQGYRNVMTGRPVRVVPVERSNGQPVTH